MTKRQLELAKRLVGRSVRATDSSQRKWQINWSKWRRPTMVNTCKHLLLHCSIQITRTNCHNGRSRSNGTHTLVGVNPLPPILASFHWATNIVQSSETLIVSTLLVLRCNYQSIWSFNLLIQIVHKPARFFSKSALRNACLRNQSIKALAINRRRWDQLGVFQFKWINLNEEILGPSL